MFWLKVRSVPEIAVIVVPAGMPTPVIVCPTIRPVVDETLTALVPRAENVYEPDAVVVRFADNVIVVVVNELIVVLAGTPVPVTVIPTATPDTAEKEITFVPDVPPVAVRAVGAVPDWLISLK